MARKEHLEAFNNNLQDLQDSQSPMGEVTLLLRGDFRQTLFIISKGTRVVEV